jgi:hypothetical protein
VINIVPSASPVNGLPAPDRPAVVLLGASNMTRGLSVLARLAASAWGPPLDVLAAVGLGRSYGSRSRVFGRALPAVLDCGLWAALDARGPGSVTAVVGDVGNDLLYGFEPDTILGWVDACVARLRARGARVLVTSLPPGVGAISRGRFLLFRSLLFPYSRLRFDTLPHAVARLDTELRALAARHGAAHADLRREWYGFDPIHIRLRQSGAAWGQVLSALDPMPDCPPPGLRGALRPYRLLAEQQWLFGRELRRAQPCAREADGSTLSLY